MLGSSSQLSLLSCNVFLTVCVFHFEKFVQRKTVQYTLESALHAATRYSHLTLLYSLLQQTTGSTLLPPWCRDGSFYCVVELQSSLLSLPAVLASTR